MHTVWVPEQLVALSFDMSGGVFMQPVAWQPLPNRLVDVVTNVCVVGVCVCKQVFLLPSMGLSKWVQLYPY